MKRWKWMLGFVVVALLTGGNPERADGSVGDQDQLGAEAATIFNPVTEEYLKDHLAPSLPRLVLTPELQQKLIEKVQTDPVVSNMYSIIQLRAEKIQTEPLLERIKTGKRLLAVSRKMLYRVNMLGIVYCVEKDPKVLARINDELLAACNFSDWNPSHFLDVGEMALAVSLALDWTAGSLPPETIDLAMTALIGKGIQPGFEEEKFNWWINASNNWGQVCHGGMIAAAITIAERDPELAAETIRRALDNLHNPLSVYAPDGVYPEGPSYWEYGTKFSATANSMLESALGTDFGLSDMPGFMESAVFRVRTETSLGFYNFSDCSTRNHHNEMTLMWFAAKTGDAAFYQKDRFLRSPETMGNIERLAGVALVWMAQYEQKTFSMLPAVWRGRGDKPVALFSGGTDDPRQYYFAAVGGKAALSHGNMDGGSFVFELDGVRWGVDSGVQSYYALEKTGFNLWSMGQKSQRWTLLTKNNFGHSTITINNQLHLVGGEATLVDFKADDTPVAVFDMTPVFGDWVAGAQRTFTKDSPESLIVEDRIVPSEKSKQITWQFMTTADVEVTPAGAVLTSKGKELQLENLSHPGISLSVVSLDPPPLELDRHIKNLKRIELRIPVSGAKKVVTIKLRLSGGELVSDGIDELHGE
ncbi:MAG: heparinase II/III family protein [Verrucomicrobiota bacterium]|nr:heparinase II/III family protein [Verrucomicrobiota bacterium]